MINKPNKCKKESKYIIPKRILNKFPNFPKRIKKKYDDYYARWFYNLPVANLPKADWTW